MHKKIVHSQKSNHWNFCPHKNLRAEPAAKHFPDGYHSDEDLLTLLSISVCVVCHIHVV